MIGGQDHMHHMQHVHLERLESVDFQRDRRSLGQAVERGNYRFPSLRMLEMMD